MNTQFNNTFNRALKRFGTLGAYFNAMVKVKLGRPMLNLLISVGQVIGGGIRRSTVLVIITFMAHCSRLASRSGIRFLVIYLKAAYVNLMQAVAGCSMTDMGPLGCRFARTNKHLPRFIPILHRKEIRRGSVFHIKLWLSLLSLYRVLEFQGKVKLNSIVEQGFINTELLAKYSIYLTSILRPTMQELFPDKWLLLCTKDRLEALQQLRLRPMPILSVSSTISKVQSTSPSGVVSALSSWNGHALWPIFRDWLIVTKNIGFLNWLEEAMSEMDTLGLKKTVGPLGRLAYLPEPAGKVRVVAMVDPFTQWAFHPLHDKIFNILRLIPQDGTFDQERPLIHLGELAKEGRSLYSFDLSAATDRLPVIFQAAQMSTFIGSHAANLWMTLLTARSYELPGEVRSSKGERKESVYYGKGQPMGALTSWAILAIHHHSLIQFVAYEKQVVKAGEWFSDYAVLGDDVVIANSKVARGYLDLMEDLGVEVGLHKSLVSRKAGAFEFAKRFIVKGASCTPVPILEVLAAQRSIPALMELGKKYSLKLSTLAAISGFGYRAISGINRYLFSQSKRMRNIILHSVKPCGNAPLQLLDFLAFRGLGRDSVPLVESERQSLFDQIRQSLLDKISSWEDRLAVVAKLVEVRRTAAHYTDPSGSPEIRKPLKDVYLDETNWFDWILDPVKGCGLRQPRITNPSVPLEGIWPPRRISLDEYNARLERAWINDRDPNKAPLVYAKHVPDYRLPPSVTTREIVEFVVIRFFHPPVLGDGGSSWDPGPHVYTLPAMREFLKDFIPRLNWFEYVMIWDRMWYEGGRGFERLPITRLFLEMTLELKPPLVWEVIGPFITGAPSKVSVGDESILTANPRLLAWTRRMMEVVYREFYIDILVEVKEIKLLLENLTYDASLEGYETILSTINEIEEKIDLVSLIPSSDKAHPGSTRINSLNSWVRRWNTIVKSTHRRPDVTGKQPGNR